MNKTIKNSLIQLLISFSKRELEDFDSFIRCTCFNKDKYVVELFALLRKLFVDKKELFFSETIQCQVYQELFENISSKEQLARKEQKLLSAKMSLLYKLAKHFLVVMGLEEHPEHTKAILYKQLMAKEQWDGIKRQLTKDEKRLKQEQKRGEAYYDLLYEVEKAKLHFIYYEGLILKKNNLIALTTALDTHYLIRKLDFHNTSISVAALSNQAIHDLESIEALEALLELPIYAQQPLIQVYQAGIQMIKTNEQTYYFQLLEVLDKYADLIPLVNLRDFYTMASNFCAHQIRLGVLQFHQLHYDLYKLMEQKKVLALDGHINTIRLKNIISLSCHIGDFEWAEEMANNYKTAVKKEVQDSIYHFNLGVIAFYQKDYKAAISHFIRVEKVNTTYDLDAKIMLLKSYYELDEEYDERTMQIFRSSARFIKEHKTLSTVHRKGVLNFVTILNNLYRVRHRIGKMTKASVRTKINKMEFLNDKKWLLEQWEVLPK